MNLYFLVEGRRTEARVYPAWLKHLLPLHTRVGQPDEASTNSYYLISGQGYPRLLDETLPDAVEDIIQSNQYDYLIICLDADEESPADVQQLVHDRVQEITPSLPGHTICRVIVQNRCIESWFLGNRSVFPRNPQSQTLRQYISFYNVHDYCPEIMGRHIEFSTHAAFHLEYLTQMLKERRLTYTKLYPGEVQEEHYLRRIIDRSESPGHLESFGVFIELCNRIRQHSSGYDRNP